MDALILLASARRDGNTGRLADALAGALACPLVDIAQLSLNPYDYEHRHRNDDFEPLMRRVLQAPAVVFASPVYWYSVSGPMKIFLDRITDYLDLPELLDDGRRLRGKHAFVACTSISEEVAPAFHDLWADTLDYLGMPFGGLLHVNCAEGYDSVAHDRAAHEFAARISADAREP